MICTVHVSLVLWWWGIASVALITIALVGRRISSITLVPIPTITIALVPIPVIAITWISISLISIALIVIALVAVSLISIASVALVGRWVLILLWSICLMLLRVEHHFEGFEEFSSIDHSIAVIINGANGLHGLFLGDSRVDT